MAVEPTAEEMMIDLLAEEIRDQKIEDYGEFLEWVKEELPHTSRLALVFADIQGNGMQAGKVLKEMWFDYCQAKAYEEARP